MSFLVKLLVNALAVIISAYLIPGVNVDGLFSAIIVALVLGLLNAFVKPILVILTLPITILTLGIFYLILNVVIIYIADALIRGFSVSGFFTALIFSFVLAIVGWILDSIVS